MNHGYDGFRINAAARQVAIPAAPRRDMMQRAWRAFGLTLLALALMAGCSMRSRAADDPTIHQVYQAAEAGRMAEAQSMMDQVLRDHPNSAKAHYVEAELLAKQGRMDAARNELAKAERIEPALSFASPQAVRDLRAQISGRAAQPGYAVLTPAASTGSSMPWGTIVIALVAVGVVVFVIRAMARRNSVNGAVNGGVPAYGNNGFGRGAPGYPPGAGYGPQGGPYPYGAPPAAGGGIGSSIMGGLATGAAVGAGMVAGEALAHHFTDRDRGTTLTPDNTAHGQAASDDWGGPGNSDMGGNDFGLSDSSSWDSGGGDSGGSDW